MARNIIIALALILLCVPSCRSEYYAVIISGLTPDSPPPGPYTWDLGGREIFPEFWHDTYLMWETLFEFGWKDENIHVLFGEGRDWPEDWINYQAAKFDLPNITDDSCFARDVFDTYDSLAVVMTCEDILFTFVFDHGYAHDGYSLFYVMNDSIYDTTFARIVGACDYDKRIFCMEQCYSGGFIDDLANDRTFSMTAVDDLNIAGQAHDSNEDGADTVMNEYYEGEQYMHGEFDYHMFNSMRLETIVGNNLDIVDLDYNGLSSMAEVWHWTDSTTAIVAQFPEMSDPGDIGGNLFLNIPPYPPTGFSGERVNNLAHLSWKANQEWDLAYYEIFKRTYEDSAQQYTDWFLLAQTGDTSFTDSSFLPTYQRSDTAWYKIAAVDSADNQSDYSNVVSAPGEIRPQAGQASTICLIQNDFPASNIHPNPFNCRTSISYFLAEAAPVRLWVYGLTGREIACLVHGWQATGMHEAVFDATNFPSGIYFCHLEAAGQFFTKKMILLK